MNTLENLAKQYFEKYSEFHLGAPANWYRLTPDRQLVWMQYTQHFMDFLLDNLNSKLIQFPPLANINTTYVQGRNEGINLERIRLKNHILELKKQLELDLQINK